MSEKENVRVVERCFEAFGRGDVPAFLETLSEDVEWAMPGPPQIPHAGVRHGREGALQFLQALGTAVEFERFEPGEFIASGDTVAVVGFERGRVRATERSFDNHWVLVFTLRDEKIARFRAFEDTYALARAFES